MDIEFLVEEVSAEAALRLLVPKIIGASHQVHFRPFQGKPNLLASLPSRLAGYRGRRPGDWRVIVLVDEDRGDCRRLKDCLEQAARRAGLVTRSAARGGSFQVLTRIAVEELEAWFFGDVAAISQAFPRVPQSLGQQRGFRDPDAIRGGTWEALERVLQDAGYYPAGIAKREAAQRISQYMDPDCNRSRSFRAFRDALREMVA